VGDNVIQSWEGIETFKDRPGMKLLFMDDTMNNEFMKASLKIVYIVK